MSDLSRTSLEGDYLFSGSQMRILIAEDDPTMRNVLEVYLGKQGYDIVSVGDGAQACQIMNKPSPPSMVILDWMMPEMDGLEVCRRIRMQVRQPQTYIIMLTSLYGKTDVINALENGADDYLTKPFNFGELRARINVGLRNIKMQLSLLEAQKSIEASLKAAGEIQRSLLPKPESDIKQVDFAWKFMPCDSIGGDIFNVVYLDENHLGVYMADVAGHGPPSAMISALIYQLMDPHLGILMCPNGDKTSPRNPADVLDMLHKDFPFERFDRHFTIAYMVIDLVSGKSMYANAAHCPPMVVSSGNEVIFLKSTGTVIGFGNEPYVCETIQLNPNDKILFISDGVEEMKNSSRQRFGYERISKIQMDTVKDKPRDVVRYMYSELKKHAGDNELPDDVSILCLQYKG